MKRLFHRTKRLREFFRQDIWDLEMEELSRAKARFIKHMKVLMITIKTFSAEKIGFQAVALSFFSTMSVVPFLAIVFAITGGLGLADKLTSFLYSYYRSILLFYLTKQHNLIFDYLLHKHKVLFDLNPPSLYIH